MVPAISVLREKLQHTPKHCTYFRGKKLGHKNGLFMGLFSYIFVHGYLRFFSIFFTRAFLALNMTGNQVTFITIILGIASAILFSFGNYWYSITAALLLQLIHILDCTDGEVARYRKESSHRGQYLDSAQHWITQPLVFIFMSFGIYKSFPYLIVFALGPLISVSLLVREIYNMVGPFLILKQAQGKYPHGSKSLKSEKRNSLNKINDLIGFMFDFYAISTFLLIFSIINMLYIPVLFYGIILPIVVAIGIYYEFLNGETKALSLINAYIKNTKK